MAKKPNLTPLGTSFDVVGVINNNYVEIAEAFDNTLSLDGSTPNAMLSDLDMNSNDVLNAGMVDADQLILQGVDVTDVLLLGSSELNPILEEMRELVDEVEQIAVELLPLAGEIEVLQGDVVDLNGRIDTLQGEIDDTNVAIDDVASDLVAAQVVSSRINQALAPLDIEVNWNPATAPDITSLVQATLDEYGSCVIPSGVYRISNRIDLHSRTLAGVHNHRTTLQGTSALNEFQPIVRTGRASYVRDIRLEYAPDVPINTTAGGRVLIDTTGNPGSYIMQRPSEIANVIFGRSGTAICDRGDGNFSVGFRNLEFLDYGRAAVEFWGAYHTGNVWSNIYVGASQFNPIWGISMTGHRGDDVFHQLNIEHTAFSVAALNLERQESVYISALHIEGVDLTSDYQGFIRSVNSNVQIDSLSTYFTRRRTSGQSIVYLGDSGAYDGADPNSVGYGQGYFKVGMLSCWGLGVPDGGLYPGQNVGLGSGFSFFFRPPAATGDVLVDIDRYDYRSYTTDSADNNRYATMVSDPHNKINWVKKRAIPPSSTTLMLPGNRLVVGQTIFDTTVGAMKVWNGTAWVNI